MPCYLQTEHIGLQEATWGTETSKYPEEEKSTEIALVAASERAPAQTHVCVSIRALLHGGCGTYSLRALSLINSYKSACEQNGLGRPAKQGESPVCKACALFVGTRVMPDT